MCFFLVGNEEITIFSDEESGVSASNLVRESSNSPKKMSLILFT